MNAQHFVYDDGGRAQAGFTGTTGDCVVRAIAIATEQEYRTVYDDLHRLSKDFGASGRSRAANKAKASPSPRTGTFREVFQPYLESMGWVWVPTMKIGQGCKVHLRADELPGGRIIASVSRHLVAVVDGVAHDTDDPSREGNRCVYGYFQVGAEP